MCGENVGRRDDLQSRVKIELLLDDVQTNSLQREEGRVSFVHVKHVRLDSERSERFHASNTQHDLLAHAHLEITAVKLSGDSSVLGAVLRNVGVEQIDVHAPNAQFPNPGEYFSIENRHRNEKFHFASTSFTDRQVIKILVQIDRGLNTVLVDLLPEIPVPIEETNRNKVQVKIAR